MTLDQLRIFVAVAERQHMTRAAEALHLAQSAASAAIAALEASYGAKLFHRVGRRIELTETGRIFLEEARAVLARVQAAELVLAERGGLQRGTLRLAASQTIAGYWLPRHLVAFRRAWPHIDIRLSIGNTAQVAKSVHDGTAELGFVEGAFDDPTLVSRTVALDRMLLLVAPDHAWVRLEAVTASELRAAEWVLREPGSGTRSVLEDALRDLGVAANSLTVALELPSNEAVRAAVAAGMGATALSASVAAASIEAGLLRVAPLALPDREFRVVRHADRFRSRAAEVLLEMIGTRSGR